METIQTTRDVTDNVYKIVYEAALPKDYVHILNCTCVFETGKKTCDGTIYQKIVGANKLDTNQASQVLSNYYMRPSINRPYYYIIYKTDPTNKDNNGNSINPDYDTPFPDRKSGTRYGNST